MTPPDCKSMSRGYLIYHPAREHRVFGGTHVYFDRIGGNQDPYVWNEEFLHTYCHMTELRQPAPGDVNFWVSSECFPEFTSLYCDLVFVVGKKCIWPLANSIDRKDSIVDSPDAFQDHYQWGAKEHHFKKRGRFTLKACAARSFQPQDQHGCLVDIAPTLAILGIDLPMLRAGLRKSFASRPMLLSGTVAQSLYAALLALSPIKLCGKQLQTIRANDPSLGS